MLDHALFRRIRRRLRETKPWLRRAALALGVSLLHLAVFESSSGREIEPILMDTFFRLRGPIAPPEDIVIVSIDEKSYRDLGLSTLEPLPRRLYSQIVDKLREVGAQALFVDFIFRSVGADQEGDEIFASALGRFPVYIGKYVRYTRHTGIDGRRVDQEEWVMPLERFAAQAAGVIPLSLALDGRTVRRFYFPTNPHPVTSTALLVCEKYFNCPRQPSPDDFINFSGPPGSLKRISLADLLKRESSELAPYLRGKLLFLGNETLTQVGIENRDAFLTPFAEGMTFGVEIHATAAGNLVNQNWIRRIDPRIEILALNITLFLAAFLAFGMRPVGALVTLLFVGGSWFAISYICFLSGIFLPGVLFLGLFLPSIFLASTLYYAVTYRRSLKRLRMALGVQLPESE